MPKLSAKKAGAVSEAEEVEFDRSPLEPGRYAVKLVEVEVREGKKAPYWAWAFEVTDADSSGRGGKRVYNNTSLSDKALGTTTGLKKTFAAFGVPTDTDTDDLIGKQVIIDVSKRTISSGDRKGELTNDIEGIFAFESVDADDDADDEVTEAPAEAEADAGDDEDGEFDV